MNLVTGGTGLLGNNLVRLLLEEGEPVRVLVRPSSDPRPLDGLPVERVRGDVRDPEAVAAAVQGVDQVYHAAALVWYGLSRAGEVREVNAGGSRVVARAARRSGARLLHVSSVDAQGWGSREAPADEERPSPPRTGDIPYCASKRAAEEAVGAQVRRGLHAVTVRPAYLLGPWDWKPSSGRMLLAIAKGRGRVAPPGGNDFCHAVDVARGCLAAARKGEAGEVYLLGGEAMSYREAFRTFAEVTGGPPPLLTAPAALVRAAGWVAGTAGRWAGREPDVNAATARVSCRPHHVDDGKARRALGYRSRPAREAAADAWRWFGEHGYR